MPRVRGTRKSILENALSYVTVDRQAEHGALERNFENIAIFWNDWARMRGWDVGENGILPYDVAIMMDLLKTARIASTPENIDNWEDKAGYSSCGGELATAHLPEAGSVHVVHHTMNPNVTIHTGHTRE